MHTKERGVSYWMLWEVLKQQGGMARLIGISWFLGVLVDIQIATLFGFGNRVAKTEINTNKNNK